LAAGAISMTAVMVPSVTEASTPSSSTAATVPPLWSRFPSGSPRVRSFRWATAP